MSAHTPGPWIHKFGHFENEDGYIVIVGEIYGNEKDEDVNEHEANARLIAAAPEMFELLKYVIDKKENADEWHVWDTANNLIQKIEGES